jgi:hypothetical protein
MQFENQILISFSLKIKKSSPTATHIHVRGSNPGVLRIVCLFLLPLYEEGRRGEIFGLVTGRERPMARDFLFAKVRFFY